MIYVCACEQKNKQIIFYLRLVHSFLVCGEKMLGVGLSTNYVFSQMVSLDEKLNEGCRL